MMKILVLLVLMIANAPVRAAEVTECEAIGVDLTTITKPVPENVREFSGGEVTIFNYDVGEPAAVSAGLAITLPDRRAEHFGAEECLVVAGFGKIDVNDARVLRETDGMIRIEAPNGMYHPAKGFIPAEPVRFEVDTDRTGVRILPKR